jgi:hypothetical protein
MPTLSPGPQLIDPGNPVKLAHPLNRGLVAWWYGLPNNGGGTRWFDLLGRYPATLTNGPVWSGQQQYGGALKFDGTNDYAEVSGSTDLVYNTGMSVACWVSTGSFAQFLSFVTKGAEGNASLCYDLSCANTGSDFNFSIGNPVTRCSTSTNNYSTGRWYRLLGVYDGNGSVLYIDGVSKATATPGAVTMSTAKPIRFGGTPDDARWYANAHVADVSLWSRALSASEAAADYVEGRAGNPNRLRRHTPRTRVFGGAAGGTAYTTSPAGSCTAAGSLTKSVSKAAAGSETAAGGLAKQDAKPLAGSATATATLAAVTAKPLAGSATATGTAARQAGKGVVGSCTAAGAPAKSAAKALAGSAAPTATLAKLAAKPPAGSVTGSGSVAGQVGKGAVGSATGTGAVARQAQKALAGGTTGAGSVSTLRVALAVLAGAVSAAGSFVRAVAKALAGLVTGSGVLTTQGGTTPAPAGRVVLALPVTRRRVLGLPVCRRREV